MAEAPDVITGRQQHEHPKFARIPGLPSLPRPGGGPDPGQRPKGRWPERGSPVEPALRTLAYNRWLTSPTTKPTPPLDGTPKAANPKTVLVPGHRLHRRRLVPRLLEAGHRVKVLVRTPAKIAGVPWLDDVEVVQSSLDDGDALREALDGVDVSATTWSIRWRPAPVSSQGEDDGRDRCAGGRGVPAWTGSSTSAACTPPAPNCPPTCAPARRWGRSSSTGPVDAVVFQAGVVIGSGSASFEMIRHLSETLPLMPAPSWVRNKIEAIAVRDVLYYLVAAASLEGPHQPDLRHRLPPGAQLRRE